MKQTKSRYRVEFTFINEHNCWVRDYLDNNGIGFTSKDASDIARQLLQQGKLSVFTKPMKAE